MFKYEIAVKGQEGRFWVYAPYKEKAREMAKRVLPKVPFEKIEAKRVGR